MSRVPVLAILGSTGCGKSRLGIELACRFHGEIISADSMQVYKGLDIITAKVTKEEQAMAVHHLLDIVDPLIPNFTVVEFRDMAVTIITNLLAKEKLPIIVGGTNYYIEAVLWHILMKDDKEISQPQIDGVSHLKKMKIELDRFCTESNDKLFKELMEVDPEMASRIHPNNRRKIVRSLEVMKQYGVKHSELLKAQRAAGGSGLGGPLRYQNSVFLWLKCDHKVLEKRLNSRVDAMVKTGLVQELLDFHRRYNEERIKSNTSADYTTGIFQSIGFKEFHAYLMLSEEERRKKKGRELLEKGIADLKLVTKRYARKQEKWIMNRIILRGDRQVPPVYVLDCTDISKWNTCVYEPAVTIIETILRGEKPEQKPINESAENKNFHESSNDKSRLCDVCERIFVGDYQWNVHLASAKHMRVLRKKKKLEKRENAKKTDDEV